MRKIYLLGNPNVGKTTLFNLLTGQYAKTGNFAGTTFQDRKAVAITSENEKIQIIDLAGIYAQEGQKDEESSAWKSLEFAMAEDEVIFLQIINPQKWRQSLALTLEFQKKGIHPILLFNTKKYNQPLPEEFYVKVKSFFKTGILIGSIEEKNYKNKFWKSIFEQENCSKIELLRTFKSSSEKFKILDKVFEGISFKKNKKILSFVDYLLLHSVFGVILFFGLMGVIFETTFTLGAIPMDYIDLGTRFVMNLFRRILGENFLADLLIDGVLNGVGATVVFLPNIMILFFFLSLLKESGYLARVSYLFDRIFKKLGLTGRASVPLLMGFGCNVPSIMAVKSFETKKEKVIVSMMVLFMSCGAKLPVYTLLISTFIPVGYKGLTLWLLYLLGICMALFTGFFTNLFYKKELLVKSLLVEMPQLVFPSFRKMIIFALRQGKIFLMKVGTFIIPASIVLWMIFSFPQNEVKEDGIERSYGANIAKTIQPIFEPIGFDWRITAGVISAITAKEVMVTTFAEIFESTDSEDKKIIGKTLQDSGSFSLGVALSLLFFTLLYTPCMAVLGILKQELGWHWMIFSAFYTFTVAWIVGFILFQIFG